MPYVNASVRLGLPAALGTVVLYGGLFALSTDFTTIALWVVLFLALAGFATIVLSLRWEHRQRSRVQGNGSAERFERGYDDDVALARHSLLLENEPSTVVARYMFPTERLRGEWRRHWIRPAGRYVVVLALAVAGVVIAPNYVADRLDTALRGAVCAAGCLLSLGFLAGWYLGRFALTQKRVMVVDGVWRRRVWSMPLVRMTDLRYEQSFPGRLLNYGDFVIDGTRSRRVAALPYPTELYLRIVEELYEPEAVDVRLESGADESPPVPQPDLTRAVREAMYGPSLVNFDGWVSVRLVGVDGELPISRDRQVDLDTGREYVLYVTIDADQRSDVAEPLVVTGGVDRDVVEFTVEVDSDERSLRRAGEVLTVRENTGELFFVLRTPDEGFGVAPWMWVRVSQQRRLLQSVELIGTGRAALEQ